MRRLLVLTALCWQGALAQEPVEPPTPSPGEESPATQDPETPPAGEAGDPPGGEETPVRDEVAEGDTAGDAERQDPDPEAEAATAEEAAPVEPGSAEAGPRGTQEPGEAGEAEAGPAVGLPVIEPWGRYDAAGLAEGMRALAESQPELFSVESIGRSAGGSEILLGVLADPQGREVETRPGLLLVDYARDGFQRGGAASLYAVRALLERRRQGHQALRLLRERVVYVIPALAPDALIPTGEAEAGERETARFDRNFPTGWEPELRSPGAGPYPLFRPEAAAVAHFLGAHPNVSLVHTYAASASEAAFARISAASLDPSGGSFLAFAQEHHGLRLVAAGLAAEPNEAEAQLGFDDAARWVYELLENLPVLALGEPSVQALSEGLWQVEVGLSNEGLLPTFPAEHLPAWRDPGVLCVLTGATLVGAAQASDPEGAFEPLPARGALWLDALAGGESTVVRLFLQAEPAAEPVLEVAAARAGRARRTLALP